MKTRLLLLPFSWIYGLIVWIRNVLFDMEVLSSESYEVPVLSIGNITVGGTGKTPHTEYLIRLLSNDGPVAVLSRGYKRKSKGYVLADNRSKVSDIGDEPLQMKKKFPKAIIAVDESRRDGIRKLTAPTIQPPVEVILLDDAYQHRYVAPSISILLIDYHRMLCDDYLLPAGNLREPASQTKRADIIIISKCPEDLKPIDTRVLSKKIGLLEHQTLFYTTMQYGELKALSPVVPHTGIPVPHEENTEETENIDVLQHSNERTMKDLKAKQTPVLVVAGIASPERLINYVNEYTTDVRALTYPDHHEFNQKDARKITAAFTGIKDIGGIIITTEKDAVRIEETPYLSDLVPYIYYPVLQVKFIEDQGPLFDQKILDYVRINKRNSKLDQA